MSDIPSVSGETVVGAGKFVALKNLEWTDANGQGHMWESAERIDVPGAVLILARLLPSDRFVLIRQFRPPARRMVIECPAGLMDQDESPARAAERELREETGYVASRLTVFPPAYTTPGLSDEAVYMVIAEIDENAAENRDPQTDFDGTENIETILVPRDGLLAFYRDQCDAGVAFDAKLAAFILTASGIVG